MIGKNRNWPSARGVETLLAHLDGPVPVTTETRNRNAALIRRGLLKDTRPPVVARQTELTEAGRKLVSKLLAKEADRLEPTGTGFPVDSPSTQPAAASPSPTPSCGGPAPLSIRISPARDGERVSAGGET